jgi:hypothetical protein
MSRDYLRARPELEGKGYVADFSAGFFAEALSCVLWVPIDVTKERLQASSRIRIPRYSLTVNAYKCLRFFFFFLKISFELSLVRKFIDILRSESLIQMSMNVIFRRCVAQVQTTLKDAHMYRGSMHAMTEILRTRGLVGTGSKYTCMPLTVAACATGHERQLGDVFWPSISASVHVCCFI